VAGPDDDAGRPVVVIGNFDGVHRGHLAVLAAARGLAGAGPVVAVTFEPHPLAVLRPDHAPAVLTPLAEKLRLLRAAGADDVLVLVFDAALAAWAPTEFVQRVLVDRLRARVVVVGENFRFGHRAAGDVALLRRLGGAAGFAVVPAALATVPLGPRVSSSFIRERLAAGDVQAARAALGRPFRLFGRVVRGDARGRELGYPTANLDVADGVVSPVAVPADGIYAVRLLRATDLAAAAEQSTVGATEQARGTAAQASRTAEQASGTADQASRTADRASGTADQASGPADQASGTAVVEDLEPGLPATLSIGTNPTFDGVERRIEAHVLDRDDLELYGERVALDVVARQRATVRFDTVDALVDQMARDTAVTRVVLDLPGPHTARLPPRAVVGDGLGDGLARRVPSAGDAAPRPV